MSYSTHSSFGHYNDINNQYNDMIVNGSPIGDKYANNGVWFLILHCLERRVKEVARIESLTVSR